jgi:hypothetical protein
MKNTFARYYQPDKKDYNLLWKNAIIVLDTNILLNLFRYPKQARLDFIKILENLSNRLWITHQAGLEYHENRPTVISEQINTYSKINNVFEKLKNNLNSKFEEFEKELGKLNLKKRHFEIDPDDLIEKVKNEFKIFDKKLDQINQSEFLNKSKVKEEIEKIEKDYKDLSNKLNKLFENKVGPAPASQQILDEYYKEAKKRYGLLIPPGYLDLEKEKDNVQKVYMDNGLIFQREFGDFILWQEIIEKAKENSISHIIFVTDDTKEDWWKIVSGKTLGPRLELIDEIYNKAKVANPSFKMFAMYNAWNFMAYAEDFLNIKLNKESIRQIKDFEEIYTNVNIDLLFPQIVRKIIDKTTSLLLRKLPNNYNGVSDYQIPLIDKNTLEHHIEIYKKNHEMPEFEIIIFFNRLASSDKLIVISSNKFNNLFNYQYSKNEIIESELKLLAENLSDKIFGLFTNHLINKE